MTDEPWGGKERRRGPQAATRAALLMTGVCFLMLIAFVGFSTKQDRDARARSLQVCTQVKVVGAQERLTASTLSAFLHAAETARRASGTPADVKTANEYLRTAVAFDGAVKALDSLDRATCAQIVDG